MEPSVHRIEPAHVMQRPRPVGSGGSARRRDEGEGDGDFERDLEQSSRRPAKPAPERPAHHEDTPFAPPDEDEAGSRLDVTA